MIKVTKINYRALLNTEFLGLQEKIGTFTVKLTNEALADSLAAYKASLEALKAHQQVDYSETTAHAASRLHTERINAYVSLSKAVKLLTATENEAMVKLGESYVEIITENENPHYLNQDMATGAINAIVTDFRKHSKEELEGAGIEMWVAKLESKQAAYESAADLRGSEKGGFVENATTQYREACLADYEILMGHVRALAVRKNDAGCISFIESVNGEVALRKEKLKMRQASAKKKANATDTAKAETAETVKTENDSTETPAETQTVANGGVSESVAKEAA